MYMRNFFGIYLAIWVVCMSANAEIINFDSGFSTGAFLPDPFVSGSFRLSATNENVGELNNDSSGSLDDPGNKSLYQLNNGILVLDIVRNDLASGLFRLTSLNFLSTFSNAVTLFGYTGGISGTQVATQVINLNSSTSFINNLATGFDGVDLDGLRISVGATSSGNLTAIDMLDLELLAGTSVAVPEPSSFAILMLGGAGFWLKRRRQAA